MNRRIVLSRIFLFALIIFLSFNQVKATPLSVKVTSQNNVGCNGENDASAGVTASGGTGPYTYLWAPSGQTTAMAVPLSPGSYTVVVTDALNNTASVTVTITQPAVLTPIVTVLSNVSCYGGNDGSASVKASGGTSPFAYLWVPSLSSNTTVSGLSAGCDTVTILDSHGCLAYAIACITQPAAPTIISSSTGDTGSCSGTATVSISGGAPPYTYLWSNGKTNAHISNLCAGTYCCTITDSKGCLDTACISISTCPNDFKQSICIITLDTVTNKCELIWGRTNSPPSGGYGHFNVYKDTNNVYTLIHSQALNMLSEYIDPVSDPSAGPVSYELSTVDSCGESALSSPHTSIYLTTTAALNAYILNWTAYVGFTPTKYIIYRGPSLSNLKAIDSVASNVLTYQDNNPPLGSYYVLEALSPNGPCVPTTHNPNKASFSLLSGSFSNGFNTKTLGVNNLENDVSNLKVYPNPSNGMFTLSYSMSGGDDVTISILNELGQQVYTEQKHAANGFVTEQLTLENFTSGIYILRIETSKGISVSKLSIMQK